MTFFRIVVIVFTLIRYRLDRRIAPAARRWYLGPLLLLFKFFPAKEKDSAVAARRALEDLGPIFIKFGQMLSTRRDLFDQDLSNELQKLQDQVPPFDQATSIAIIRDSLGDLFEQDFTDLLAEPIASASLAQVHSANLTKDGKITEVVIKVIRPGIRQVIDRDLRVMHFVARMIERFWQDATRLHPVEIVRDYERTILGELNLAQEALNTNRLRENWHNSSKLYVPRVFDEYTTSQVMVMERIYGVTATDLKALEENSVNLKKLAHLGVEIFFTQVFEDNFFHADMHPGNVFVDITDPDNPSYIALDCAIIGSLTEDDKNYLARNLLAFFNRDYDEVARLHVQSGWVPIDTNTADFARVIRDVCDPFFQKPIKEISFGTVLLQLFQTARQFNMEVQPQLVLLQKTLINIEGMGRQIYPDLDLWETAAPFMERWMNNRIGVSALLKQISERAPRWIEQLPELPDLAYNAMVEISEMAEQNRAQVKQLREVQRSLTVQARRSRFQRLGGLALIAALLSMLAPAYGASVDPVIPVSVLGSLGIYWMYIHS